MLYVVEQKQAQQIYQAALDSPQPGLGRACPTNAGPSYQLLFRDGAQPAEIITADQSGCGDLFLYYLHGQLTFSWHAKLPLFRTRASSRTPKPKKRTSPGPRRTEA